MSKCLFKKNARRAELRINYKSYGLSFSGFTSVINQRIVFKEFVDISFIIKVLLEITLTVPLRPFSLNFWLAGRYINSLVLFHLVAVLSWDIYSIEFTQRADQYKSSVVQYFFDHHLWCTSPISLVNNVGRLNYSEEEYASCFCKRKCVIGIGLNSQQT